MQAILTKYIPCTHRRGSRVKATADAGSVTLHWRDELDSDKNHEAAALALCAEFGWHGELVGGGCPQSVPWANCYVFTGRGRKLPAYVTDPYAVGDEKRPLRLDGRMIACPSED